ncbi:MAG: PCRF domain-containing protein, partial [Planctomycetota bacterium]|nr:PCRF domain-containing protein [Planctomycetota bacterium]
MREMLDEKLARFEELEAMMSDPEVLSDAGKMAGVAREHGALGKIATKYRNFRNLNDQILETRELLDGKDAEMRELAEMEMPALKEDREKVWNEILELTIGGEDATRSRCVMEIRAGTGGDEAALFARDLF